MSERNKTVSERSVKERIQIEPYIRRDLKERLDAEKADRNVPLGVIVDAALEQYFGLRDETEDKIEVLLALTAAVERKLSMLMGHLNIEPRLVGEAPTPEPAEEPDSLEQWYGLESSRRPEAPPVEDTAPVRRKRSWWR